MSIQIRVVGFVASTIIASAASAQTAVEWKVSEGGNGHWYQLVTGSAITWNFANAQAQLMHGHLCTITSVAESEWVWNSVASDPAGWRLRTNFAGPHLGGQLNDQGQWTWITGEPWSFENGGSCFLPSDEGKLHFGCDRFENKWNNILADDPNSGGFIVEWSADCNSDGIVDYGQIKSGQLADDNTNGIPDICETSITGVLPPSVPAQGGSTITINGRNFPAQPSVLVDGVAATNIVRVSDSRLTAVTPPLLPGMAPLTVNGFTLPDAIYIRPECGSDLDQNGVVDAGDISIILLDFGPCYEPPSTFDAPAPTPLLLPDATAPVPTPPAPQTARPAPQLRERSS